jgi:AcrR family transcriptional regulator
VLRAAARAFARAGWAATSMEDVAAEAGVTKLIVYRHFDSKEDLYRAVLQRVAERLREEFAAGVLEGPEVKGVAVRSLLTVAREDPDGFRLLMVHAAREPDFAGYAAGYRREAAQVADSLIGDALADQALRAWATRTTVAFLVAAVLEWLEVGDERLDDQFVDRSTDGLVAMVTAWTR